MYEPAPDRLGGLAVAHFTGVPTFNQQWGGYAALPWVFRTLLSLMSAREWTLLTYLYLRSGKEGLTWETDRTIAFDMGIGHKKLGPHVKRLQELGFIQAKRIRRNRYIKLVDPMVVAERLLEADSPLSPERQKRLSDDLQLIRQVRRRSRSRYQLDEE